MFHRFRGLLMSKFKYRDRVTIFRDILRSLLNDNEGKKKTNIMQSANLNYEQANKYIGLLIMNGFIMVSDRNTYKVTRKGVEFLNFFEKQSVKLK